ncbi:Dyp-type peroxidase [Corynebacterium sp. 320]|uniref:Dyp-type peroxidase n=1 Tax=Corynebacterium TaxID=1716 RepID=UPI00125CB3E3|nr:MULTISPECIES: Dyp-type peroxidase [Corynebacterium]KAB1503732.1 Dyp-type peroxidase [Corynebacterium sp. 320]KAB1553168.1 Dyp-type peroxidase [Corynebacterium sp. 321]KAB1553614.1 Dyp-type peroxidase [Corynebacterium sp. 319]KAB3527868.1 Dyp-type peroxidase [Corynebacterium sp. 250]KAB3540643.1 Dyp-type peroxidase [Corynebacterium sp. 366]
MNDHRISRRGFFAGVGLAGAATVLASCQEDTHAQSKRTAGQQVDSNEPIAFDGPYQAGIETPPQSNAILIAYNLTKKDAPVADLKKDLRRLLKVWTQDARTLCAGGEPLADLEHDMNEPGARLTITFGLSPELLAALGLASDSKIPTWVPKYVDGIPSFPTDQLQKQWVGGDIILQICGDNLTSVSHAARHLTRAGAHYCTPHWTQRGFLDAPDGHTPRNLLGFKDGTAQPRNQDDYDHNIWDEFGGTAMVVRRVVFDIPGWEKLSRSDRETAFGRHVDTGAPLGGSDEFEDVDLSKTDATGLPVIDPKSHVGIAAGLGTTMRRRAFNWDNDVTLDAESGLIFICFQNDPDHAFTPLQRKLAANDRMNTWMTHIGSAVFWIVPGTDAESYWGESLLAE